MTTGQPRATSGAVVIYPQGMTAAQVVAVAREGARVELSTEAVEAMSASRRVVEELAASPDPGLWHFDGFGALATRHISSELRTRLQASLIRSHRPGSASRSRLKSSGRFMLLRLKTLACGYTGARPVLARHLAAFLNSGVTPVVPASGSLGCSGDLAPLAHCALVLMGEGEADRPGRPPARRAERSGRGYRPLMLEVKEGLAFINGTDGMLGMLVLACQDFGRLCTTADMIGAMSVEALLGTDQAFLPELQALTAPSGPGRQRHEHAAGAGVVSDRGFPSGRGHPRPGCLLTALRSAGNGGGARHARPCQDRRRTGARLRH